MLLADIESNFVYRPHRIKLEHSIRLRPSGPSLHPAVTLRLLCVYPQDHQRCPKASSCIPHTKPIARIAAWRVCACRCPSTWKTWTRSTKSSNAARSEEHT